MDKSEVDLKLTPELLSLEDIEIVTLRFTSDKKLLIRVKSTKGKETCHICGGETRPHGYGRTLPLRHLPIFGHETIIEITPPRFICERCDDNPTTTQTLSWYKRNGHYTTAYEQHILLSLVHSTIADVSIKEEICEQAVQLIFDKSITDKINWKDFKRLGVVDIDEIALKKGHKDFLSLVTCRVDGKVHILGVIEGREKTAIKAFFESIPHKKRKTIAAICCDMYDGYINAAKEVFGDAIPVVADRFHVAKLYRAALISIRKKELARLRKELLSEEYKLLKPSITLLVKKKECYRRDDKFMLEALFKFSPAIKAAYRMARHLTAIFNAKHRRQTATNKIEQWIASVQASEVVCFNGFIITLQKYKNEITNYFIDRDTSGFVEGFNNKVKAMKRRCYGIFNIKHFFQRLFLDLSGYRIYFENQSVIAAI